ncbi:hypothetical protein PAPYR_1057 [Paratrimastix pyriformis]|uniref:WD repeat-containing protein 91 n=1 Tax=Paratrimastix pyriformis TaxID=342808 RepID=A0ABQ8UXC7_9EUKA|nr:hypothetical protein PAPYR_1057 [Paratrimastix pyriformis]
MSADAEAAIQDYLLWRGFSKTLVSFLQEKDSIPDTDDFRPERLVLQIFLALETNLGLVHHFPLSNYDAHAETFLSLWGLLEETFFHRAEPHVAATAARLKPTLLRYYLVHQLRGGEWARAAGFFRKHPEAVRDPDWAPFLSVALLQAEQADPVARRQWAEELLHEAHPALAEVPPAMEGLFTAQWSELIREAVFNLFAVLTRNRGLPGLLDQQRHHQERRQLQAEVGALSEQIKALRSALQQSREEAAQWRAQALDLAAASAGDPEPRRCGRRSAFARVREPARARPAACTLGARAHDPGGIPHHAQESPPAARALAACRLIGVPPGAARRGLPGTPGGGGGPGPAAAVGHPDPHRAPAGPLQPGPFRRLSAGLFDMRRQHYLGQRGQHVTAARLGPIPGLCASATRGGEVTVWLLQNCPTDLLGPGAGALPPEPAAPAAPLAIRSLIEPEGPPAPAGAAQAAAPGASDRPDRDRGDRDRDRGDRDRDRGDRDRDRGDAARERTAEGTGSLKRTAERGTPPPPSRGEGGREGTRDGGLKCRLPGGGPVGGCAEGAGMSPTTWRLPCGGRDTVVSCLAWTEGATLQQQQLLLCGTSSRGLVRVWDVRALGRGLAHCSADVHPDEGCPEPWLSASPPAPAPPSPTRGAPGDAAERPVMVGPADPGPDEGPFPWVTALACNPHEKHIFAYAAPRLTTGFCHRGGALAFALRGGQGGRLGLFDLRTRRCVAALRLEPAPAVVLCLRFNHNGTLLLTGGSDGYLRLYDTTVASQLMGWRPHTGPVRAICFTADETAALSLGDDGQVLQSTLHQVGQRCFSYSCPSLTAFRALGEPFTGWLERHGAALEGDELRFMPTALEVQGDYFVAGGLLTKSPPSAGKEPVAIPLALIYRCRNPHPVHFVGGHSAFSSALDWHCGGVLDDEWTLLTTGPDCIRIAVMSLKPETARKD